MPNFWICAAHLAEIGDNAQYFAAGETIHIVAESECRECREDCDPETAADHADDTSVFAAPNQGYSDAEIRAITGR